MSSMSTLAFRFLELVEDAVGDEALSLAEDRKDTIEMELLSVSFL
jgi:hypothetical protein